jgi:TonB family protein
MDALEVAYDHRMGILEAVLPAWARGLRLRPEDRTSRYLAVTVLGSLLAHVLFGVVFLFSGWLSNPVIATQGKLLFVDTTPDKPSPALPARSVAEIPRPAPRAPEPREVTKAAPQPPPLPQAEEPAYEGRNAQAPSPPQTAKALPDPPPPPTVPSSGREPRVASAPASPPAGLLTQPGDGGGLPASQGGLVGQAVPLDTADPNYREYLQQVRQRIYAKWSYPREVQNRELHGKLVIEFKIGKDGQLLSLELSVSSGEAVLDNSAITAVKLAERYPPLPEALRRDVLPVVAVFTYRIGPTQSSVFQTLQ